MGGGQGLSGCAQRTEGTIEHRTNHQRRGRGAVASERLERRRGRRGPHVLPVVRRRSGTTDAIAIHYCGPTDRAPTYCMGCARPLGAGETACATCGLPAGEVPKAVDRSTERTRRGRRDRWGAARARAPVGTTTRTTATATAAAAQSAAAAGTARTLRISLLVASLVGTLAFFVPWGDQGAARTAAVDHDLGVLRVPDGITIAELQPTHLWGPPSANLMLGLALACLVLSLAMNLGAHARGIAAVIAAAGGCLAVFCFDWLWLGRHVLDVYTGLWVVTASGVALFALALLYVRARRHRASA